MNGRRNGCRHRLATAEVASNELHVQIAECEMIRDLATEPKKRELFGRLAEHFKILAADLERALPGHRDGLHKTQEPLPKDV